MHTGIDKNPLTSMYSILVNVFNVKKSTKFTCDSMVHRLRQRSFIATLHAETGHSHTCIGPRPADHEVLQVGYQTRTDIGP